MYLLFAIIGLAAWVTAFWFFPVATAYALGLCILGILLVALWPGPYRDE